LFIILNSDFQVFTTTKHKKNLAMKNFIRIKIFKGKLPVNIFIQNTQQKV